MVVWGRGRRREREGRYSRSQSIRRSASSPGVGRVLPLSLSLSLSLCLSHSLPLFLFPSVLSARPPIIIIFYHNICFSHILFYVNGRCLPPSTRLVLAPFSRWFPLRMHGLGELLAFCLEFKKFFRRSRPPAPRLLRATPAPRLSLHSPHLCTTSALLRAHLRLPSVCFLTYFHVSGGDSSW